MRKGTKHKLNYRGSPEERFWKKVKITDDCWIWFGTLEPSGYGVIRVNDKNIRTHRYSYELAHGEIDKNLFVCHSCDNRQCVRPDHLWVGTNQDNVNDMVSKMRHTLGEKNGCAKLKEEDIKDIRSLALQMPRWELAKKFNIGESTLSQIINYKRWAHIK